MRQLAVGVCYASNDYAMVYKLMRHIIASHPSSVSVWNLFYRVVQQLGNFSSANSLMVRTLKRYPDCIPLMLLIGHNKTLSGVYKMALGEYFRAFKSLPNEPLIALCIGVNYLNLVMARTTANRHAFVVQAFAFLYHYYDIQKKKNAYEANYNLARAYHLLGINHLALHYYEQVLTCTPAFVLDDPELEQWNSKLKREAAFNLSIMYRSQNNPILAKQVLREHLTIV